MLSPISKILGAIIMAITAFYTIRNLLNSKVKLNFKNICYLLLIVVILCAFYNEQYTVILSLIAFLIIMVATTKVFAITLSSAIIVTVAFMIIMVVFDFAVTSVEMLFMSANQLRSNIIVFLGNNLLISIASIGVSHIKFFSNQITSFCTAANKNEYIPKLIYSIVILIVVGILYYNITSTYKLNIVYAIATFAFATFIMLYYFYIEEHNKYDNLTKEYTTLFDYVQDFEEWIDNEQLYRHELKNNLSIIRGMTKNKKIIAKIDEMLNINISLEDDYIDDLSPLPKGNGLKGLIYYKIVLAKKEEVKITVDVSRKITATLQKLSKRDLRQLSILLGIYIDNAIEAAKVTKKKIVSLEIYLINNELHFVISNTYNGPIKLKDINKKGYTTKGGEHGKGLYYASKTIAKNPRLSSFQNTVGNFFVQKLIIKPD